MTELQVYGVDGLFHAIIKASSIMRGNYHVLPTGTNDLNAGNITGLKLPENGKYPLTACLAPVSTMKSSIQDGQWEDFLFRLLFVDITGVTPGGEIRMRDESTNGSHHTILHQWRDMKQVGFAFLNGLEHVTAHTRNRFRLDDSQKWRIIRISNQQTDKYSGVMVQFNASLATDCDFEDIPVKRISSFNGMDNG